MMAAAEKLRERILYQLLDPPEDKRLQGVAKFLRLCGPRTPSRCVQLFAADKSLGKMKFKYTRLPDSSSLFDASEAYGDPQHRSLFKVALVVNYPDPDAEDAVVEREVDAEVPEQVHFESNEVSGEKREW